jgi:carboxyl-terminal processing protease
MPDYFVPVDTTDYSEYYRQLINKGIFNRFVLQYVDNYRNELLEEYPDFESYQSAYTADQSQLDALIGFAKDEGLEYDQEGWEASGDQIALLMKSYLARDLWGMEYFYEVYNDSNEVFNKAVEILTHPDMLSQKLAKAEPE